MTEPTATPAPSSAAPSSAAPAPSAPTAAPAATEPTSTPTSTGKLTSGVPLFTADATESTSTATPSEAKPDALILGKFKTQAELEKSYGELEKTLREKGRLPPESYDIETAFKNGGITPLDRSDPDAAAKYEEFEGALKEQGFSQDQLNWLTSFGGRWMRDQMLAHGPAVDLDAERETLTKTWGSNTKERAESVAQWAAANLPVSLMNKPLLTTAEGYQFLERLMKEGKGPIPIQNTRPAGRSVDDIELEIRKIMSDGDYYASSDAGRALQRKADQLFAEKAKHKS